MVKKKGKDMTHTAMVYKVGIDFQVSPILGESDSIEELDYDQPVAESSEYYWGEDENNYWQKLCVKYVKSTGKPIHSHFFKLGNMIAASTEVKQLFSDKEIEWLDVANVEDCPEYLQKAPAPHICGMRFRRTIRPGTKSKLKRFSGGLKLIESIVTLSLPNGALDGVQGFCILEYSYVMYATDAFLEVYNENKLKGLKFTPVKCSFE